MPINRITWKFRPSYQMWAIDEETVNERGHFLRNVRRARGKADTQDVCDMLNAAHAEGIRLGHAAAVEQARRMIGDMNLAGLADALVADHFQFDQIQYHTRPDRPE